MPKNALAQSARKYDGTAHSAKPIPIMVRPMVMAGLNPRAEIKALDASTPRKEPTNWVMKNIPAWVSSSFHLAMKIGRIGPMKVIMMPLTTKPPQSSRKIRFCVELPLTWGSCVSEGIMAFCRSRRFGANGPGCGVEGQKQIPSDKAGTFGRLPRRTRNDD